MTKKRRIEDQVELCDTTTQESKKTVKVNIKQSCETINIKDRNKEKEIN